MIVAGLCIKSTIRKGLPSKNLCVSFCILDFLLRHAGRIGKIKERVVGVNVRVGVSV
jgi:hypothetical protein